MTSIRWATTNLLRGVRGSKSHSVPNSSKLIAVVLLFSFKNARQHSVDTRHHNILFDPDRGPSNGGGGQKRHVAEDHLRWFVGSN